MEFEKRTELMRKTRSVIRTMNYVNTVEELVAEDPARVALVIGPPSNGTLNISTDPNMLSPAGYLLPTGGQTPLMLNLWDHGDVVKKKLYKVSSAGAGSVGIIETYADGW